MKTIENIKIDKNIPLPLPKWSTSIAETIKKMNVGDSIHISGVNSAWVWSRLGTLKLRFNMGFTVRREDNGVRLWRIK